MSDLLLAGTVIPRMCCACTRAKGNPVKAVREGSITSKDLQAERAPNLIERPGFSRVLKDRNHRINQ